MGWVFLMSKVPLYPFAHNVWAIALHATIAPCTLSGVQSVIANRDIAAFFRLLIQITCQNGRHNGSKKVETPRGGKGRPASVEVQGGGGQERHWFGWTQHGNLVGGSTILPARSGGGSRSTTLWWSYGGGQFFMSEVYLTHKELPPPLGPP